MSVLELLRLMVDFGLVILVWMVQLIIYPSFRYMKDDDFDQWHKKYTGLISPIVAPLMLGQIVLLIVFFLQPFSSLLFINALIISIIWWMTFSRAVPIHNKLSAAGGQEADKAALIGINRFRAYGWTAVFVLSVVDVLYF